jgi:hypothetical protein
MDGLDAVAARLAQRLGAIPRETPRLVSFAPRPAPPRVVAVDGSSVVLAEAGDLLAGAYRVGVVRLEAGAPVAAAPREPTLVLLSPDDPHPALGGVPLEPAEALHALRTLGEIAAAREALRELRGGDLLLLDGALAGTLTLPALDAMLADARRAEVDVVGVCKSTRLRIGPSPALVACRLAGRGLASPTWMAPLVAPPHARGAAYAARLCAAEERVFRFDIMAADGDAARVLGGLAALSGHPAYPGYPSPLAMAHNAALLNEETRRRLRARLVEAVLDAGLDAGTLQAAFMDYHDVLELGA